MKGVKTLPSYGHLNTMFIMCICIKIRSTVSSNMFVRIWRDLNMIKGDVYIYSLHERIKTNLLSHHFYDHNNIVLIVFVLYLKSEPNFSKYV